MTISRSPQFDLGLDRTRIKDLRDAERQSTTVDKLLGRFFNTTENQQREIQVLADEVGMGKTFVGLGVAYSLLESMRNATLPDDLHGCYQKVLIVTPSNSALFSKWRREVGEFVKRCVHQEFREQADKWFTPASVDRVDDLVCELRRQGSGPRIIIANMGIFGGSKFQHYDVKRRQLLGVIFRYWGNRFRNDLRLNLLKGSPSGWPSDPRLLEEFDDKEKQQLKFTRDELATALSQLERTESCLESLLELCKEIAQPYVRGRDELFSKVSNQLNSLYRSLMPYLLGKALPLVVVDEAHNWKNGPSLGSNGYRDFTAIFHGRIRRLLLLSATPFQLRPAEMLEILKVSDCLQPCRGQAESELRRKRLENHREQILRPILDQAAKFGRGFAKAWSKLSPTVKTASIQSAWESNNVANVREVLFAKAGQTGVSNQSEIDSLIEPAVLEIEPEIRQLIRESLRLFVYNADLSNELGAIVIRHRRQTGHRHFRVGIEFEAQNVTSLGRLDRHVLHSSHGMDVKGDGELPHYLLMRCVSEMKGGKGRSSLGSALTGCYSTLINSAEGKAVRNRLAGSELGKIYLDLLMGMVSEKHDPKHPKVREVVDAALENWKAGEKTLIFCFRTNSAKRLHEIIGERIRKELNRRRDKCMGGPESMKSLRTRLTGRDRDLVVLGMDRVLWSMLWSTELHDLSRIKLVPDALRLTDEDVLVLAEIAGQFDVDLLSERVDRVFVHRATECAIARRLISHVEPRGKLKEMLQAIADIEWVRGPYGLVSSQGDDDSGEDSAHFDERGVHTVYDYVDNPRFSIPEELARELVKRRSRTHGQDRIPILDVYEKGPNLWLYTDPKQNWENAKNETDPIGRTIREMQKHAFGLTYTNGVLDWESRRATFQAIRRAVLRESVLLRLLPSEKERDDSGWGELLVEKFFGPLPRQRESMADRIAVFLEDLVAASGSITDNSSARFALFDATKLRDQQFVALVSGVHGSKDKKTRERIFSGFNTPLLPEILICTSVGQEGIDLHRHCRHVIHFDLAWNPAVMEQRTGRTDRIGSKTFRERDRAGEESDSFLEIGVPYLAGTYDERMYEELRLRAQTFEVLTGGDLAADESEGADDQDNAEGEEAGLRFVPLPDSMVEALRVNLHVWSEQSK